jgi:hypothetical protein
MIASLDEILEPIESLGESKMSEAILFINVPI